MSFSPSLCRQMVREIFLSRAVNLLPVSTDCPMKHQPFFRHWGPLQPALVFFFSSFLMHSSSKESLCFQFSIRWFAKPSTLLDCCTSSSLLLLEYFTSLWTESHVKPFFILYLVSPAEMISPLHQENYWFTQVHAGLQEHCVWVSFPPLIWGQGMFLM